MKKFITIGILSLILSSCMTTKKHSTFIDTKISSKITNPVITENWLIVKTDKLESIKHIYDQKKNSFVPAVLYWGWNSTSDCELDLETRMGFLKQGSYKAGDSLNLKQELAGKKLEIHIKEVPGKFLYENKGSAIIFVIAYTVSGVEAISPYPINLEFEYKISQDNGIVEQGDSYV